MKFKPVSPARSLAPYTRPFSQTHAQHIFTLPSRSLEACTTSLSHFHRAFFQEIRLISFFLGLSLSLYAVVGCRQRHDCVYQRVTDIVVDQQVVKLIITSSNHTHVWWNRSRPASFSSGPKASLYSTVFKTIRHWLNGVIHRYNPETLTKQQALSTSCCFVCCSDCKV